MQARAPGFSRRAWPGPAHGEGGARPLLPWRGSCRGRRSFQRSRRPPSSSRATRGSPGWVRCQGEARAGGPEFIIFLFSVAISSPTYFSLSVEPPQLLVRSPRPRGGRRGSSTSLLGGSSWPIARSFRTNPRISSISHGRLNICSHEAVPTPPPRWGSGRARLDREEGSPRGVCLLDTSPAR